MLQEAERSIRFYKNVCENHENCNRIVQQEIKKLKTIIDHGQATNNERASLKFSDFTTKIARKAIIIGLVLIGVSKWNGTYALSAYTANIFKEMGSTLIPPEMSAIVTEVVQLIATCITAATIDRFGRKVGN